ncbi:anti sigma factor C-terminal domain-containing protein [Paenibacillus nasutitermitis]|uniref:Sigma factor regulator C-terminal domain-containing protein n=1 Tax=Paenibacillus nasutitermitis TaxID=1652958 RepID=A0A916ZF58_9BACL|nr:anti sigma factor C-terminal domain-containing protein [Paenibacillus nasutitermitis]GGD93627.1 hypothetical protein GCM10010911_60340 [Paenibacillus nasutitermitis]
MSDDRKDARISGEETEDVDLLAGWKDDERPPAWEEKKFKRMIWRTRFSVARSVAASLLAVWFLYMVYMMIVQAVMDQRNDHFVRYVSALVETEEGVNVDKFMHTVKVSPFLTQKATLNLFRQVGDWDVVTGEVTARKNIFGYVSYTVKEDQQYLYTNNRFSFAVPPDLTTGDPQRKQEVSPQPTVWNQTAHIDSGHVAELAFSTVRGMDPEQLRQILDKYDLKVLRMPVYSGELREKGLQRISYSSNGELNFVSHLTLRPYMVYFDGGTKGLTSLNDPAGLKESVDQMLTDMDWLADNGSYNGLDLDKVRLAYLKQNGVKVYGAVVTGPVRELERLKQEKDFFDYQLGRVEIWKWKKSP